MIVMNLMQEGSSKLTDLFVLMTLFVVEIILIEIDLIIEI